MSSDSAAGRAQKLDGKALSGRLRAGMQAAIENYVAAGNSAPGLAVVLVGDDPASAVYVRNKQRACEQTGMHSCIVRLPANVSTSALLNEIDRLNAAEDIHGLLVQLPLPEHINTQTVLEHVAATKDVDGFNAMNMGRLVLRDPGIRPCTPHGVMALLHHHGISTRGMHAVVVGASNIVGRPMALELLLDGATVTVCHRFTRNLEQHVRQAELLVSAVGKTGIVDANWLQQGVVVVDIAMNRAADGSLCGDLDAKVVRQKASWYTPIPGGVGPMTVTMLLMNTMQAAGIDLPATEFNQLL